MPRIVIQIYYKIDTLLAYIEENYGRDSIYYLHVEKYISYIIPPVMLIGNQCVSKPCALDDIINRIFIENDIYGTATDSDIDVPILDVNIDEYIGYI